MCWFLLPFWEKKSLLAVSNFFAPFTFIKKIDCIFFRFLKQSQLFYFSLFPSHIQFGEWNCWLKFLPSFQKAKKLRERERLSDSIHSPHSQILVFMFPGKYLHVRPWWCPRWKNKRTFANAFLWLNLAVPWRELFMLPKQALTFFFYC